jgi:peptidoglycan hydrolase-like protein with peptidoglycan-binding domain
MHFEASDQLIRDWAAQGLFGTPGAAPSATTPELTMGDRSSRVAALQAKLNAVLGRSLDVDGVFGPMTRTAVMEMQRRLGRAATGNADTGLLNRLGI